MLPLLLLFSSIGHAQDAVSLRAVRTVAHGEAHPSVTIDATVSGAIAVRLSCGGRSFSLDAAIAPGGSYTLELRDLPRGDHRCRGTLTLRDASGGEGQLPLDLTVSLREPPKLSVAPADLDLTAQRLVLAADRPLDDVQIDVFGPDNVRIGGGRTPAGGVDRVPVTWASEGEIVRIDVTARDDAGIAARLELIPWSYAIPHEDVIFATNAAEIAPSEVPKLEAAWTELQSVVARYGSVVEVRLYVAGYTDTVGDAASNQALSERRARSIAAWFRDRGFKGPVAFQGFGESAPAVPTADGVDEPRNRRALYVLAARPPATSADLPRADWRPL
jgi:outer membrane protein OmpA-like peptidoglycan-associated protein